MISAATIVLLEPGQLLQPADVHGISTLVASNAEAPLSVRFAVDPAPGPYFGRWFAGLLQLFEAHRLYPDTQRVRWRTIAVGRLTTLLRLFSMA